MPSSESYEEILTTHLNDMYALAFQLTGSQHNAEDLVQDLFINLSMRRYQEREIERPKAWLATILYRTFVDQWRRQKRSPVIYGADENSAPGEIDSAALQTQLSDDPAYHCEQLRKQELALAVLQQLNERQRQIIILHDLHEYTMNEIAAIMELPLGTIKSNLHRARNHIDQILQSMQVNSNNPRNTVKTCSPRIDADLLQENL